MNNTIKLAVASALLAAASSASAAGGIVAGDWTLDIGGIVNAYYTSTKHTGASATDANGGLTAAGNEGGAPKLANITTGLLPNYLTVGGKTRQNDLDVAFLISIQPGGSTNSGASGGYGMETRQQFLTFGDASWGSFKLGKDLGIFASDAILNDMTLLGVGSASGNRVGSTTTLGRIGTGYIYADWKNQVSYTSANFNGLSFTAGVTQAWNQVSVNGGDASTQMGGNQPAFEAKVSYAFNADAVTGKVWASGISQKNKNVGATDAVAAGSVVWTGSGSTANTSSQSASSAAIAGTNSTANAYDIGANINAAGFGLTGYYFNGEGIGHQAQMFGGYDANGQKRDSDGYYVQATYALPGVGTKLGVSYGQSNLDMNTSEKATQGDLKSKMLTFGAYHPLTKHLNLVAEYSEVKDTEAGYAMTSSTSDDVAKATSKQKIVSLGAILFF